MNADQPQTKPKKTNGNRMTLSFDLRLVVVLLLVVIGAMLILWKPWDLLSGDRKNQVVSVNGEATVTAIPDEYVFSPSYVFKNADKAAGLNEASKKSEEIVKKLKELGVPDNKIKTNASGQNYSYYYDDSTDQNTYSLHLTVTVNDKELSQKVQDYLLTTTPTGAVSPQASFSDKLRKKLENEARDEAAQDARAKAERMAKNLGFTVGKVKSISDNGSFGGLIPLRGQSIELGEGTDAAPSSPPSLDIQPGENDIPYYITVVYYVN